MGQRKEGEGGVQDNTQVRTGLGGAVQNGRYWCLQAAGTPEHREGPWGGLSGEGPVRWVTDLDDSLDELVRNGSGPGGQCQNKWRPVIPTPPVIW